MSERWIVIPNWDKFQHYTDRDPPWIKLYTELNSNDDWCDLSDAERGLLVTIWIEYARSRGTLKVSRVPKKIGQASRVRQLERLNHAGFIEFVASKPLALARSRESEKKERREKTPSNLEKKRRKAMAWLNNNRHELEGVDLAYVIGDQFEIGDKELVADLVAYATERMALK